MSLAALALPLLRQLPAELAHRTTINALRFGLGPRQTTPDPPSLAVNALGQTFSNPLGLAAGFDKNGEVPDAMLALGMGHVEVGTVTPRPQAGNPKPRLFRLNEDQAVINRMGFNNNGLDRLTERLQARQGRPGIVGANIGANKDSEDRINDYVLGLKAVIDLCNYVTVNISSPNTPGLRGLQDRASLEELLGRLVDARTLLKRTTPLVLKIAPDLSGEAVEEIVAISISAGIDGLIATNTTIARPDFLQSPNAGEAGGLSGVPLMGPATDTLRIAARAAAGRLVLIGAGGVTSGRDAFEKLLAGADLVQLYTGLVFHGPDLVSKIKRDILTCMIEAGVRDLASLRSLRPSG